MTKGFKRPRRRTVEPCADQEQDLLERLYGRMSAAAEARAERESDPGAMRDRIIKARAKAEAAEQAERAAWKSLAASRRSRSIRFWLFGTVLWAMLLIQMAWWGVP